MNIAGRINMIRPRARLRARREIVSFAPVLEILVQAVSSEDSLILITRGVP